MRARFCSCHSRVSIRFFRGSSVYTLLIRISKLSIQRLSAILSPGRGHDDAIRGGSYLLLLACWLYEQRPSLSLGLTHRAAQGHPFLREDGSLQTADRVAGAAVYPHL